MEWERQKIDMWFICKNRNDRRRPSRILTFELIALEYNVISHLFLTNLNTLISLE